MKAWKLLMGVAVILVLAAGGFFGAYFYTLSQTQLAKVNLERIDDLSLDGFTFRGNMIIRNGGIVPVTIKNMTYDVLLQDRKIGSGIIDGEVIEPKSNMTFTFESKVELGLDADMLLQLAGQKEVFAGLNGTVTIEDYPFARLAVPFEQKVNVTSLVGSLARVLFLEPASKEGTRFARPSE